MNSEIDLLIDEILNKFSNFLNKNKIIDNFILKHKIIYI